MSIEPNNCAQQVTGVEGTRERPRLIVVLLVLAGVALALWSVYGSRATAPTTKRVATSLTPVAPAAWSPGVITFSARLRTGRSTLKATGMVTFTDRSTGAVLCRADKPLTAGWYACSTKFVVPTGWHGYTVRYSGNVNFSPTEATSVLPSLSHSPVGDWSRRQVEEWRWKGGPRCDRLQWS